MSKTNIVPISDQPASQEENPNRLSFTLEEMLKEFENGAVPRSKFWRELITALYDTANHVVTGVTSVADVRPDNIGNIPLLPKDIDAPAMVRMDGADERERQSTEDVIGRQLFYGDACKVVHQYGYYYEVLAGTAYVAGIKFSYPGMQALLIDGEDLPTSVWLDVSLQSDEISDIEPVVKVFVSSEIQSDYVDANNLKHYLEKISFVGSDGVNSDYRTTNANSPSSVTHTTFDEAVADTNHSRNFIKIAERNGAPFKKVSEFEYHEFKGDVGHTKFRDNSGSGYYWVLDVKKQMFFSYTGAVESEDNYLRYNSVKELCCDLRIELLLDGIYNISKTVSTVSSTGNGWIPIISGFGAVGITNSGLRLTEPDNKVLLEWERTLLRNIRLTSGVDSNLEDNGSVGLSGGRFTSRAENIRIDRFGTGHLMHTFVDCHIQNVYISNCYIGSLIEGSHFSGAFSTTGSYTNAMWHSNVDGIVFGSKGHSDAGVVTFEFRNCIYELNKRNGIVCARGDVDGVTYDSNIARFITFSGFQWFEGNGNKAFVLDNMRHVVIQHNFRLEANQTGTYPTLTDTLTRYGFTGPVIGLGTNRETKYLRPSIVSHNSGYELPGARIYSVESYLDNDKTTLAAKLDFVQQLDYYAVGRTTAFRIFLKSEHESEATEKFSISRIGDVSITRHITPKSDGVTNSGNATFRINEYFGVNDAINTSDEREKNIKEIPDSWVSAADNIKEISYQWTNEIEKYEAGVRENKPRWHIGYGAQSVFKALDDEGIEDPWEIAFLCKDALEKELEDGSVVPIIDEETGLQKERWGLRTNELNTLKLAAIERKLSSFSRLP